MKKRIKVVLEIMILVLVCYIASLIRVTTTGSPLMHMGTVILFVIAILKGSTYGSVVGGLSMIPFHMTIGYGEHFLWSIIAKVGMGYIVGKISHSDNHKGRSWSLNIIAMLLATLWNTVIYAISWWVLTGSINIVILTMTNSIVTSVFGILGALVIIMIIVYVKKYRIID